MTAGLAFLESRLDRSRQTQLAPPPKLTVSQWADRYRMVSSYSAEPGPWQTSRTPYLREIMDSFGDPAVQMVIFMKCARIGGTEAGLNIVGYFIDQDPSPILIVQPTVDDAKDFSKEQLAPMLADTPALAGKVQDPRSRDSGNTVQSKTFPGGGLYLVGANSPRGFRRRTARVVDLEEVDGYPASAGTEGDQIKLAFRRTATYAHRRKVYMNSTPTLKGASRIEDYFSRSDQRRFHLPCPHCQAMQPLVWRQLRWDGPEPLYFCIECGAGITESDKFRMLARGVWVPERPDLAVRGYHINALYSPWVTWRELVDEWLEAQTDIGKLQVFVNTVLGETWEDRGGGLDPKSLESRREDYGAAVPAWVSVLTAGVDVQENRLALVIRGWGQGEESALIVHTEIDGDPTKAGVWNALDEQLTRTYGTADGRQLPVFAAGVDTGDNTESAYAYCRPRWNRRVYALKGSSTPGAPLAPRKASINNKGRVRLFLIGTTAAKDLIYGRLKISMPGPGRYHFPPETTDDYFVQVTAEKSVREQINGRWIRRYKLPRGARNEALDCEVYALAALYLAPINRAKLGLNMVLPPTNTMPMPPPADLAVAEESRAHAQVITKRPAAKLPRRGGWAGRW